MITIATTTVATSLLNAQLGSAVTVMLILFLVQRELAKVGGQRSRTLAQLLLVVIATFLSIFVVTVVRHLAVLVS